MVGTAASLPPAALHVATTEEADRYRAGGWWSHEGLASVVDRWAASRPDATAYIGTDGPMSWADFDRVSRVVRDRLIELGVERGEHVAVLLPDTPLVHAVYIGVERAGSVIVGIGPRAGRIEIEHILNRTGATTLVSPSTHREHDFVALVDGWRTGTGTGVRRHIVIEGGGPSGSMDGRLLAEWPAAHGDPVEPRRPDEVFLLNSTSGTTGLPKVVVHTVNRWVAFHRMAVEAGALVRGDVMMSVIPAPFGFGIWTAHVTPILLGGPCVVMERFGADEMLRAVEEHRVTVLGAVSTQFIMALGSPEIARRDLTSLRAMFTGGEAVPTDRAARFEEETGASVLQFFGSNETGALSVTTTADTRERRLETAGRVIPVMSVRLFDDDGNDVTSSGGPGQPGCRGPATCLGYYDDPDATEALVTPDGWMLTGDIVTVDDDGYLRVVGRKSDFIIRGGKNISAPAVEEVVLGVPGVAMAAVVAVPSSVYGERVCAYVVTEPGSDVDLPTICDDLGRRGVTKESWPEFLVVVDELPTASGGKLAKAALRADAAERVRRGEMAP